MIEIKTQEQLIELAARSIYLLSNLRSWEREADETRALATLHKDEDVEKWQVRSDEFLKNIDAVEFSSLKDLITQLSNKTFSNDIVAASTCGDGGNK